MEQGPRPRAEATSRRLPAGDSRKAAGTSVVVCRRTGETRDARRGVVPVDVCRLTSRRLLSFTPSAQVLCCAQVDHSPWLTRSLPVRGTCTITSSEKEGTMLRQRLRSTLTALTVMLAAGGLVATTPPAAQADDLPLPLPVVCGPSPWRVEGHYEDFKEAEGPWRVAPGGNLQITVTKSDTLEVGAQLTVGMDADYFVGKINTELSISAKSSWTSSVGLQTNITSPPHEITYVYFGIFTERVYMTRTWSPAGCNDGLELLVGHESALWLQLPKSEGFKTVTQPIGRGGGSSPGRTDSPAPPQPQPVTSVHGLADGTLLHTTDTQRIYKMVGGAPVWQATCDSGICDSTPRPTYQSVIDAGPKTPRNGSSAIDQRGRVYIYVGGAPLHQSHCNSPVNCGRPPKISDWSIDARDHMNQVPADGSLVQGWNGGNATPVAQTVGGARINFASPQEVIDTGHGTDWASKVVIVSDHAFNSISTVPVDGTLVQGTGGGSSTPVAMFVAGSRINFASPEEVVETGYGTNWREKVRAIPSRAFNEFHADIPPDGSLIQGIANGVPTPVAMMFGGARVNFASPQEVIDAGFGTDWASKVRTVPTRAFNMIRPDVPDDGILIQGTGGTTPVAAVIGGARVDFASPQEVIDAGFGTDWASKVRALPARAFSLIPDRIADGTRIRKAGSTSQAGIVGRAKVPFASMDELTACGFGDKPTWTVPARVWDALTTEIADGTRIAKSGSSSEAAVVGGARVDFHSEAERNDAGYDTKARQVVPARVWDAMTTRIADGTRIAKSGWSSEAAVVGGARVDFHSEAERNDAGYDTKARQVVPVRVWDAMTTRIADGTRIAKSGATSEAAVVGGARVDFHTMDELLAAGYGAKPRQVVPVRVWEGMTTRIADGTRIAKSGSTSEAAVVGGARVDFHTMDELLAAGYGVKPRQVVPVRVWDGMTTRIADGTRIKDAGSSGQAAIVGGAKVAFHSMDELTASGYANVPMQVVPNRVWQSLSTQIGDGTRLKSPDSPAVWLVAEGRRTPTDTATGVWTVPQRVIDAIPLA
ncbi:hypothetical protein [Streptomyces sp. NPDC127092]|uniref:hypothetical protein n=1 Tax=Streptomyces sp. NPDC127092 TaxID=3347135 RepID=UPI0036660F0D